ncbi:MAG: beta-ketoacyl synthase [Crocinitomicaceae bacterium]|nr:beta-ketoacyl synthase [Crocinitomicaceae bacterium]
MNELVWICGDSIASPLGIGTENNFNRVFNGDSSLENTTLFSEIPYPLGHFSSRISGQAAAENRFEKICLLSLDHLRGISFPVGRTLFILSTTKGNIDELGTPKKQRKRYSLHESASFLASTLHIKDFTVVSSACISGVLALIYGQRQISSGLFDHVVVTGADILSEFVVSGFRSLNALSTRICRPYDAARDGINIGEAAATIVLSNNPAELGLESAVALLSGAVTNDANHISGPSRTGEELAVAVRNSLEEAHIAVDSIDFISAHGTGTIFNDEMESKAFHIAHLDNKPLNSFKGYYGHTLGASGVLESVLTTECLRRNLLIRSVGFEKSGTSFPLNIITATHSNEIKTALKTASGFGGGNASLVLQKTSTNNLSMQFPSHDNR